MLKRLLTSFGIVIASLPLVAQVELTWPLSNLPYTYTNVYSVVTPQPATNVNLVHWVEANADALIPMYTQAQCFEQTGLYWHRFSMSSFNAAEATLTLAVDQPKLNLAVGSPTPGSAGINQIDLGFGARHLKSLYVGVHSPTNLDQTWNYGTIYNEDTLYIEEVWVPKGSTLTLSGTAPVIITRELHNKGTIICNNDNIILQFDLETASPATFENKGLFIGEVYYEVSNLVRPDFQNLGYAWDWYQPQTLEDSLEIIYPYLTEEEAALLQQYWADGNTNIQAVLDEMVHPTWGSTYWGYSLHGVPVKGVRFAPYLGDVNVTHAWKNHSENLQFPMNISSQENTLGGYPNNIYDLISENSVSISILTTTGYQVFYDADALLILEQLNDGNDAILFDGADLGVVGLPDSIQITGFSNFQFLGGYETRKINDIFNLADGEGEYQWHDGTNLPWNVPNLVLTGYSIGSYYSALYMEQEDKFPLGESPEYLFAADTLNSHIRYLFPNTPVSVANNVDDNFHQIYPGLPDYFPNSGYDYGGMLSGGSSWQGSALQLYDGKSPLRNPIGLWGVRSGNDAAHVTSYKGFPWLNDLDAYIQQPYHDVIHDQGLVPNNPPAGNMDHTIAVPVPFTPGVTFVYASNGQLFEQAEWNACLDENVDWINPETGLVEPATICATEVYGFYPGAVVAYPTNYNNNNPIDVDYVQNYNLGPVNTTGQFTLPQNPYYSSRWSLISNPVMGYLDLDKVAEQYFQDYPDAVDLRFAWWATFTQGDNSVLDTPAQTNEARQFWYRTYRKVAGEIVSDEWNFWASMVSALADDPENLANLSNLALTIILDYADGELDLYDGPAANYLLSANIIPNRYIHLGQYAAPGSAFWVWNNTGTESIVKISSDMAVYDFEHRNTSTDILIGEYGNWQPNPGTGERSSISDSTLYYGETNMVLCYAYLNDTSYYPAVFLDHVWEENAENGTHQHGEDALPIIPFFPYTYTDSSNFGPAQAAKEGSVHNQAPLRVHIPPPNVGGAWVFEPIMFQKANIPFLNEDNIDDVPFVRLGMQLYDGAGNTRQIKYLSQGDTIMVADNGDWEFPVNGYLYFTALTGDLDGNGVIGSGDLLDMLFFLGSCSDNEQSNNYNPEADFNGDGCITTADLLGLLGNYGATVGNADGEFVGACQGCGSNGEIVDGPELVIVDGILDDLPSYVDVGFTFDETTRILGAQGHEITVYSYALEKLVTGNNRVTLPNGTDKFFIVTNRAHCVIDVTVPNVLSYDPGSLVYNTVTYTAGSGSGLIEHYQALNGQPTSSWIGMYTNYDFDYAANNNELHVSPYINQLYYGWNSNSTTGNLYSPSNARVYGLIDMFGGGSAENGMFTVNKGVYADPQWDMAANAYKNYNNFNTSKVFTSNNVPLAYISGYETTNPLVATPSKSKNIELRTPIRGGLSSMFGKYSELTTVLDPAVTEWGTQDAKEFHDVQVHHGVAAMVDMMSIRDYFRFKLKSISPKFGEAPLVDPTVHYDNSFGPAYNLAASTVNSTEQAPYNSWAPSMCSSYQEWTTNIVAPFFAAYMGQSVSIAIDAAPPGQDGIERNLQPDHYEWFTNSPMYTALGTYGPLVYDFNWDGVWTQEDLDIWSGITAYWSALGDDATNGVYKPAAYYRSGTDALNTIVNVLPNYETLGNKYIPTLYYNQYFDLESPSIINEDIANWHTCLDGNQYISNKQVGPYMEHTSFQGDMSVPFIVNGEVTPLAMTSSAPRNLSNSVEVTEYGTLPIGYALVPSASFFPVSNTRQIQ